MRGPAMVGETRPMAEIREIYDDLNAEISFEEFEAAVEAKVEQMGGLADEETAAMLVAHEHDEGGVETVSDIEPGMEDVQFTAKVTNVEEVRSFDRDDGEEGRVLNVEVADETGVVRVSFWDRMAEAAVEQLDPGDVIGIGGRPKEGYAGVEVSVDDVSTDVDADIDVTVGDTHTVDSLTLGMSGVNVRGRVLSTESVRTFDRDDGSEGKVANLALGDPTGRVRVTMWDDMADRVEDLAVDDCVEVVDGYVRERDGDLEVHCNDRSAIEYIDEEIKYVPESVPIDSVEIGDRADLAGVVRSADPKRTFDRDDGSEGQVRNVRIQDDSGDIRVAFWGEKADTDVGPGDRVAVTDVEIQDGWQDDLEASANWRSTVTLLEDGADIGVGEDATAGSGPTSSTGSTGTRGSDDHDRPDGTAALGDFSGGAAEAATETETTKTPPAGGDAGAETGTEVKTGATTVGAETIEFTGTVVQAGDPVVLDDGESTLSVETDTDLRLGQQVTIRGQMNDGRLYAEDVF